MTKNNLLFVPDETFIFCIYFFADRNDQSYQNDYNSQGAPLPDFHGEEIPGGAPGAAKNDHYQKDIDQAIKESLRTANDQTGKERENGGNGNGNEPQNNDNSAKGKQKEKINSRFS